MVDYSQAVSLLNEIMNSPVYKCICIIGAFITVSPILKKIISFFDFKTDKRTDEISADCAIVKSDSAGYFRNLRKNIFIYLCEFILGMFLLPIIDILLANCLSIFVLFFKNECSNNEVSYILVNILVITILARIAKKSDKAKNLFFCIIAVVLSLVLGGMSIIFLNDILGVCQIVFWLCTVSINFFIYNLRKAKISIIKYIKNLLIIPAFNYVILNKSENCVYIMCIWVILTSAEYIYNLFKTYTNGKVFINLTNGEKYAVKRVFEMEDKIVYIDENNKRFLIPKNQMAYITVLWYKNYRYLIYKNREVQCKFIDGRCYFWGDFWVDKNKYAYMITKTGDKIYICKYGNIISWRRMPRINT